MKKGQLFFSLFILCLICISAPVSAETDSAEYDAYFAIAALKGAEAEGTKAGADSGAQAGTKAGEVAGAKAGTEAGAKAGMDGALESVKPLSEELTRVATKATDDLSNGFDGHLTEQLDHVALLSKESAIGAAQKSAVEPARTASEATTLAIIKEKGSSLVDSAKIAADAFLDKQAKIFDAEDRERAAAAFDAGLKAADLTAEQAAAKAIETVRDDLIKSGIRTGTAAGEDALNAVAEKVALAEINNVETESGKAAIKSARYQLDQALQNEMGRLARIKKLGGVAARVAGETAGQKVVELSSKNVAERAHHLENEATEAGAHEVAKATAETSLGQATPIIEKAVTEATQKAVHHKVDRMERKKNVLIINASKKIENAAIESAKTAASQIASDTAKKVADIDAQQIARDATTAFTSHLQEVASEAAQSVVLERDGELAKLGVSTKDEAVKSASSVGTSVGSEVARPVAESTAAKEAIVDAEKARTQLLSDLDQRIDAARKHFSGNWENQILREVELATNVAANFSRASASAVATKAGLAAAHIAAIDEAKKIGKAAMADITQAAVSAGSSAAEAESTSIVQKIQEKLQAAAASRQQKAAEAAGLEAREASTDSAAQVAEGIAKKTVSDALKAYQVDANNGARTISIGVSTKIGASVGTDRARVLEESILPPLRHEADNTATHEVQRAGISVYTHQVRDVGRSDSRRGKAERLFQKASLLLQQLHAPNTVDSATKLGMTAGAIAGRYAGKLAAEHVASMHLQDDEMALRQQFEAALIQLENEVRLRAAKQVAMKNYMEKSFSEFQQLALAARGEAAKYAADTETLVQSNLDKEIRDVFISVENTINQLKAQQRTHYRAESGIHTRGPADVKVPVGTAPPPFQADLRPPTSQSSLPPKVTGLPNGATGSALPDSPVPNAPPQIVASKPSPTPIPAVQDKNSFLPKK